MENTSPPDAVTHEPKPAAADSVAGVPRFTQRQWLLAIVVVLALVLAVQWYYSYRQMAALQLELAQRLAAADVQNKESRSVAEHVREATREVQVRLGVLETRLQESQNQQIALEALYQELSSSRDESLLADVEQTLLVANQQLQVAGNIKSALIALQAADVRLARLERPQLANLRKVIARDIERLKVAPFVDLIGISARLDNLINAIDSLPLAVDVRSAEAAAAKPGKGEADGNAWTRFTRELWQDLRGLIRIQNLDRPDLPLLAPAQSYFLRENLKLRLLSARLSLIAHDEKSYKADLKAARDWLTRYYDARDKTVASAVAITRQLHDSPVGIEPPDLAASIETVRNYRLARERR